MEILFVLRKNQIKKNNPSTIYIRITINGLRSGDFSSFIKVLPDEWNSKSQLIMLGTDEAMADNERLLQIRTDIKQCFSELIREGRQPTAITVEERYLFRNEAPISLQELMGQYKVFKTEKKIAPATMKTFVTRQRNILLFMKETSQLGIAAQHIDEYFINALEHFITVKQNNSQGHAVRHLRFIKECLTWAKKRKLITYNALSDLNWTTPEYKEMPCLTLKELIQIEQHSFGSKPLQEAADRFLMQCYSGLNFADLMNFEPNWNIVGDWIKIKRQKTGETAIVPLLSKLKTLLEKYSYKPPKITNQAYNRFLKEIAAVLDLKLNLTTRVARKTAGQLWLDAGLSIESVSKMLGHSNIRTTQKSYVKVTEARIEMELKKNGLW
ncbi:tyrosine-type recombinase/integrase [Cytophagaceae bacterium DM2B3-1]|uniref:Tyrosine-type recombinase/integrase n=1 Tax=Xanthocytophaga flava TaxID=3048013 RepID=A0ABT7CI31_9BACT|nr:tyrosine-type recombinase/integrase [Xanthocytophaga flavus]MDJ1493332.1 tyrosine-type recombinase/integrase [Xanthocytophaga flavus]